MALPSWLTRQYGPFNGITWIGVIGGGAVLAYFLRKAFSGSAGTGAQQTSQDTASQLHLPGTTYHQDTSGPTGGSAADTGMTTTQPKGSKSGTTATAATTTAPARPATTATILKPSILLFTATPTTVAVNGNVVLAWQVSGQNTTVKLKRPVGEATVAGTGTVVARPAVAGTQSYTLTATNASGSVSKTVNVLVQPGRPQTGPAQGDTPGGFPRDCTGVMTPANTATSVMQVYNDKRRAGLGDRISRDIATQTAIQGIANMPGLGLGSIVTFVKNQGNWPGMNRMRRTRGLRALTANEYQNMAAFLEAAYLQNGSKSLTNAQLEAAWNAYHAPYTCANPPRAQGSRTDRLT